LLCRDLPKGPTLLRPMIHRHLAWLTALRYQVRQRRVWERQSARSNEEYQRKRFRVAEWDVPLETELQKFLAAQEMAEIAAVGNQAGWLLGVQSAALRELYVNQDLAVLHHTEMQRTLKDMLDQQGRAERIKNFPYPRQYAAVNTIFIWSFALCLPLCLVREFDRLNDLATGFLAGHLAWLTVPFSTLIAWLYFSLDQVARARRTLSRATPTTCRSPSFAGPWKSRCAACWARATFRRRCRLRTRSFSERDRGVWRPSASMRLATGQWDQELPHRTLSQSPGTGSVHERHVSRRSLSGQGCEPVCRVLYPTARLQVGDAAVAGVCQRLDRESQASAQWPGGIGLTPDA